MNPAPRVHVPRYQLEPLEPRIAPAVFVVNTLDDIDTSGDPDMDTANIDGDFDGYLAPNLKAAKGTFVVTNLDDDGPGSLRQAIIDANDDGKKATIVFDVTQTTKGTIKLDTPLDTFTANHAGWHGGGLHIDLFFNGGANLAMKGILAANNMAGAYGNGGGLYLLAAGDDKAAIRNSSFLNNTASNGHGGGILFNGSGDEHTLQRSTLTGNFAGNRGGGIFVSGGEMLLSKSTLTGNTANGEGGGLRACIFGSYTLDKSKISGNWAPLDPNIGFV